MLDDRIALGGKTRDDYRVVKAALVGEYGDAQAAIDELDTLIATKPGNPAMLNQRCWIKATRNVALDTALKDCTSAMELSDSSAAILDSRALVWMRMGRDEDALRDLDAALLQVPAMGSSRFLRALVYKRTGRGADAAADLAIVRRMSPSTERDYARFGLKP
jgi:predicted Zn-dependent protease